MARKSRKNPGCMGDLPGAICQTAGLDACLPAGIEVKFKVGLYARLSVEDIRKKESNSIGTQISLLMQYINEQPDMLHINDYVDADQTGTNFKRPGFNRLLEDIRAKRINCIVVKDLSRFGRNYIETGNYLERVFPFMGVRFISVNDNYDSLSATGDESLVIPIKNLMNEIYAKDISKKVRSQYEMKRKRGDFCGCFAPYGYTKDGSNLIVDESAAVVVRRIFKLVIEGYSDHAIACILNDESIFPPNRHRYEQGILKGDKHKSVQYWYKSVVKRITENTSYLGRLEQGKYRTDFMNGGNRISLEDDKWVVVDNTHPPIIDTQTFEAVAEIRKNRKHRYEATVVNANRPTASENILKGLIFCYDCKRAMIRHKIVRADGQVDYSFLCPTYEELSKYECTKKNIMESRLLLILHSAIKAQLKTLADVQKIIDSVSKQQNYAYKSDVVGKGISKINAGLSRIMELRSSLYEDYKEGILSKSDYMLAKTRYEAQHKELSDELGHLLSQKNKCIDMLGQNKWAAALTRFTNNKEPNRELLTSLIGKVEIGSNNEVSITVNYHDEYEELVRKTKEYAGLAGRYAMQSASPMQPEVSA